jgi:chemotaxis protein methyltransferase WspC
MNLAPILALLRQGMGLNPASVGKGTVTNALRRRMAALGCVDEADYEARLSASQDELQELIEEVSIPETWFFREESAFACLRSHVQHVLSTAEKTRPFRIACVPCATGEEAYSIAMTLLDMGLPADRFKVHALDISYRALIRAQQGLYSEYSFRAADKRFRSHYFQTEAKAWRIDPAVGASVSFHHGSALSLPGPFSSTTYDVVFCRNMLIYLDPDAREQVVTGLKRMLAPDGILLVGYSEVSIALQQGFTRGPDGALRLCKPTALPTAIASTRRKRQAPVAVRPPDESLLPRKMPFATTATPAAAPAVVAVAATNDDLAEIRSLADTGQLEEARLRCADAIRGGVHSAGMYCLQGLILNAQGNLAAARECYRKALYLDPQHADARWQLSLADQRRDANDRPVGQ